MWHLFIKQESGMLKLKNTLLLDILTGNYYRIEEPNVPGKPYHVYFHGRNSVDCFSDENANLAFRWILQRALAIASVGEKLGLETSVERYADENNLGIDIIQEMKKWR